MPDLSNRLASLAGLPAAAAVGALGLVRRRRAFHPVGIGLTGTWLAADDTLDPLAPSRPWPVVARLSKGVGLPGSVPDVLGLAVRLPDLHGPDRHQDLLFASSGAGGIGRVLLRPTNDHGHAWYSTLVPYDTPIGRGALWARAELVDGAHVPHTPEEAAEQALAGDLHFVVGVDTGERDHLLGEVRLHERLAPEATEGLQFDPSNAGPGLRPTGFVNELRERAYRVSQRVRPTPEDDGDVTEEAVRQEATP
jgi:hypothetical protein